MASLEVSACSRVTRAGAERWQTSTRPTWGSWLESVELSGEGGDTPESRGSRTHLAGAWTGAWHLGEREGSSDTLHRRGTTRAKGDDAEQVRRSVHACALPRRGGPLPSSPPKDAPPDRSRQPSIPYFQCQGD